ncbi:hypothetical protein [Arachidicoccus soli]|uniref:Uncharacterized protein n=1 Tax=Arachidicoccus soli TaxID=2341117 RepID=A0A386HQI1_9BACT|nr:hypothetical protein [Arachidicoccus soli]AYD48197.1 hypothetical protein D6B99_11675 [Arachidicoccus soli]
MALDKDILGAALNVAANNYNDKNIEDLEAARLNFWTSIADTIISHFKTNGEINTTVATTGTATAQTGTGTGIIK